MMKTIVVIAVLLVLVTSSLYAQFSDNFTDDNFTENPTWVGNDTKFEIDITSRLHLNAPALTDQAFLSTASEVAYLAEWEFYVKIEENPSGSNYASIFLISDQQDLTSPLNGYFVKVGDATDEVSLYRQDGATVTKIIDGMDDRVNAKPVLLRAKVTLDDAGNWELFTDNTGGFSYISEGTVEDATYRESAYFGVQCIYTSTRSDKFFFDDFSVTGTAYVYIDSIPPVIENLTVLSAQKIQLQFSEITDTVSAANPLNYQVEMVHPVSVQYQDSNRVELNFESEFENGAGQTLRIAQVQDTAGNMMQATELEFVYFEPVAASFRNLVINEIFPDPNPKVDSLPDDTSAEFIELHNNSEHPFDLNGWQINGSYLESYLLLPHQYLILCRNEYQTAYEKFGAAVGVTDWRALSNSGSTVTLHSPEGNLIDSLAYTTASVEGGYTIEQVNPNPQCPYTNNYLLSIDLNGGTPGKQNAVFNDAPDTTPPLLTHLQVDSSQQLTLGFNEPMDIPSLIIPENYFTAPQLTISAIKEDLEQVTLTFTQNFQQKTHYTIAVSTATDCSGNAIQPDTLSFFYDTQPPAITHILVVDTSTVTLTFDEDLVKSQAEKEENYFVNNLLGQPKSAKMMADSTRSVMLVFEKAFAEDMTHLLSVSNLRDSLGNTIADTLPATVSFTYSNQIDTIMAVDANLLDVYFSVPVEKSQAVVATHYQISASSEFPQTAFPDQQNPKLVHLVFGNAFTPNKLQDLSVQNLRDVQGNLINTPINRFIYDTQIPKITGIEALSPQTVLVHFSEALQTENIEKTENYEIPTLGFPDAAQLQSDARSVLLTFPVSFENDVVYNISVNGLSDFSGNLITTAQTKSFVFDVQPPALNHLVVYASNHFILRFSEPVDGFSATNVNNFVIDHEMGLPDSAVVDKSDPALVHLWYDHSISEVTDYTMVISNLSDAKGNMIASPLSVTFHNRLPTFVEAEVKTAHQVALRFSKPVDQHTAENLSQYLLEQQIRPDSAQITKDDPAVVRLTFGDDFVRNKPYILFIENMEDKTGHSMLEPVSTTFIYDPKTEQISLTGANVLLIEFSVPLDVRSEQTENFDVPGMGRPIAAILNTAHAREIKLVFPKDFEEGQSYYLKISGLIDALARTLPASSNLFGTGISPAFNDLLITEIMADPDPPRNLPNAEYLELHNPTGHIIALHHVQLSDATGTTLLPDEIILPGEYLIICAKADQTKLSAYGRTIGISGFPSLNSSGDLITLRNAQHELIFSVPYQDTWYREQEKQNGGWALELIDTHRPCGEKENWAASEDPAGGTPGRINSIRQNNPDLVGPRLVLAQAIHEDEIQLTFSEKIPASILTNAAYQLDPSATVKEVSNQDNDLKTVILSLQNKLLPAKPYTITVTGISDCHSNRMSSLYQSFTFYLPEPADSLDVLLNEILFAPRSGGVKFLEIYNNSDKHINLKNWKLANIAADTVANIQNITEKNFMLEPRAFLVLTENPTALQADYPHTKSDRVLSVTTLPSYAVAEGSVVLLDSLEQVMQVFDYSEDFHFSLLDEKKGVSLERISWELPVNQPDNWQSAASTAGYATPGFMNSQFRQTIPYKIALAVEPKVFMPDQSGWADFTQIQCEFEQPGNVGTIMIYDASGRKVRDLARNVTLSAEDSFKWDGTDNHGNRVTMGYYLVYMRIFNLSGTVQVFKEKVVVASRF